MTTATFSAARTPEKMVNREIELSALKDSFCRVGKDTRVIIIEGGGGLGKTRLLSEALWRAGHPDIFPTRAQNDANNSWDIHDSVVVSDLLDFTEVSLHTFEHFMEKMHDALLWHKAVEFPNYEAKIAYFKRKLKDQANYFTVREAAQAANDAFFEDYQQLAERYRIVWALDTAEQLSYPGAPWLLEKGILSFDDLNFSTQQRLLELLKAGKLPHTTLILVGRPTAREFFDQLKTAAAASNGQFTVETIELTTFSVADVQTYLARLAVEYRRQADFDDEAAAYLEEIAEDEDRVKVLHLYTRGQPVSLALFVDILTEGKQEPEALQDTFEEARERLNWNEDTDEPDPDVLSATRFEIEEEFIRLIFAQKADLRSRILTALVRARRGLDVDRLIYILSHTPNATTDEAKSKTALRDEIERELNRHDPHSLRWLSFVKDGVGGKLILQDELYRIYDEHMGHDNVSKEDEARERKRLYRLLQTFAEQELVALEQIRNEQRLEDLASLNFPSPAQAQAGTARFLGREDEEDRIKLAGQILEIELERLHYRLRINPDEGLNDEYFELADQRWLAGNEEADVQVQIELWRFLREKYARRFIAPSYRSSTPDEQTYWQRLINAAEQLDVAGWLKRFWLRGQYERAIDFADRINEILPELKESTRSTLNHTFSRGERLVWQGMAQIYTGQDIPGVIDRFEKSIQKSLRLLSDEGIPERTEDSFKGHPAESRLKREIGLAYNRIGYGYTVLGQFRQASENYAQALRYLRGTGLDTQKAVVHNNLSRVLSEMGLNTRSIAICEDALELKKKMGTERQIAVSYSTLALIYNNALQPENAWVEAAKAIAYFRKLEEQRGLGLALYHLAEALRRLAVSVKPKENTPEQLFDAAFEAITETVQIFSESPEGLRYIEALIEQGTLYRDYMFFIKDDVRAVERGRFRQYRNQAVKSLKKALTLAEAGNFPRHKMDALVDLAYTYYYADEIGDAEATIQATINLAPPEVILQKESLPPSPKLAEPYVFMLLGKICTLKGQVRMDQFMAKVSIFKETIYDKQTRQRVIHQDQATANLLQEAAEAFVLALGYSKLYSVRSPVFSVTLNALYNYLRKFNETEMADFYRYQRIARKVYNISDIQPEDTADLELFLLQAFGDYFDPESIEQNPSIQEVG